MCRTKPFFLIFKGPPAPKQIKLLKSDTHYDGCTLFPAFVNRSYWCSLCEKGFNVDDAKNHPCEGRTCQACNRKTCSDYNRDVSPTLVCPNCHCRFYSNDCFDYHREKNQCAKHRTCPKCNAEYNVIKGKRHRCGFATCPSCREMVEIHAHKCFIQLAVHHPEEDVDDDDNGKKKPLPPPLFVYADIEAMQLPDRQFEANLLCYRTSESEMIITHKGEDCVCTFLHDLDDVTEIPDDDRERTVIVIFHNLKGFDGMFIKDELYKQQRGIENQLTVGSKVLSFQSESIRFKDSLCFLPMPFASFLSAFNLTLSSRIQFATSPKLRGLHPWHWVFWPRWNVWNEKERIGRVARWPSTTRSAIWLCPGDGGVLQVRRGSPTSWLWCLHQRIRESCRLQSLWKMHDHRQCL